jgi:iron complex outermembrane recepter protein
MRQGTRCGVALGTLGKAILFLVAMGSTLATGGKSFAQSAGATGVEAGGIEQVLVTAEQREENLQNVPISISALSGYDLQAAQISNYEDIARAVPGVSFNSLAGVEGEDNIAIRGISSTSGSAAVGIYINDVSITVKNFFDGSSEPLLYDVDRVEVLRGPQGTLYGASSEGGAIRFITKQPDTSTYSSEVSADSSGTDHGSINYNAGGFINIPIVPGKAAIRISAYYEDLSGYIDHIDTQTGPLVPGQWVDPPTKKGVNQEHAADVNVTGKLVLSDNTTITPAVFMQQGHSDDNSAFYPALGLWKQNKQVAESGTDILLLPSLTIDHDFGFANLTSVTGDFYRQYDRWQDGTYYNSTLFAEAFLDPLYPQYQSQNDSIIGNLGSPVKYFTRYEQISQEFRLASDTPGPDELPLRWLIGLYFSDQHIHNRNFQQIPGINTAFEEIYGIPMEQSLVNAAYGAPGVPLLFPNNVDEADEKVYDERQYAVFGQIDYDVFYDLHASVGMRYLWARDSVNFTTYGFYQIGNVSPFNQTAYSSAFTPKYTLTYDVDPSSNVYASASEGFRLGGPEPSPVPFGPTTVCAGDFANIGVTSNPLTFASDHLWTYELGSKNRLDDDRLSLDGAGYFTQWTDVQQQIYLPTCGYYFTANLGNAQIYGGEVEARFKPIPALTLGVTSSVQHAVITSTLNPATAAVGENLIDVPRFTVTGSIQYDFVLASGNLLTFRSDYTWTGASNGSYQVTNSNYYNPGYGIANASIAYEFGEYEILAYVKNLTNNHTIIQQPEINTVIEGYTVRPLTAGVSLKVRL